MTGRFAIFVLALCLWAAPASSLEIDPGGLSFFNINTEEDLTRARMLAGEGAVA